MELGATAALGGIPFFYWYRMAWVPLTVVLAILVYIETKSDA